jgi:hypothetical protein
MEVSGEFHGLTVPTLEKRVSHSHWIDCWAVPLGNLLDPVERKTIAALRTSLQFLIYPALKSSHYTETSQPLKLV